MNIHINIFRTSKDTSDEATTNKIEPTHSDKEEDKFFEKKYQRKQLTSAREHEELSDLEVRDLEGNNEEERVIENLPIMLGKGKILVKYPIS